MDVERGSARGGEREKKKKKREREEREREKKSERLFLVFCFLSLPLEWFSRESSSEAPKGKAPFARPLCLPLSSRRR